MSVSLNPPNALGFRRPLTTLVKRSLTITNHNQQPVAFKVKTTAPKLYCVRPNSGRVEPGESVEVSVMLQALKEEPPLNTKCKDKFLIQSTIITADKETLPLSDIWASPEANEEGKVFQQKLRVTYLPPEGQVLEEEEEPLPAEHQNNEDHTVTSSNLNGVPESSFTQPASRLPPADEPAPVVPEQHYEPEPAPAQIPVPEPAPLPVPAPVYETQVAPPSPPLAVAQELAANHSTYEHAPEDQDSSIAYLQEPQHEPTAPAPAPAPIYITKENPVNEELYAKYNMAQAEIEQLKAQVASLTATQELRRRTRKISDVDSNGGSEVMTVVEDAPIQQDGVPLQVVVVIALGVFITTYLFF